MLFYTGVTVLRMSERTFWRSTPVKLNLLSQAHAKANSPSTQRVADTVEEVGFEI